MDRLYKPEVERLIRTPINRAANGLVKALFLGGAVYLETTIPSYLAARPSRDLLIAAHQQITQDWWDTRRSAFDLFAPSW